MIRPNLVLLGLVPGLTLVAAGWRLDRRERLGHVALFGAAAAIGPMLVASTQWMLYGGPFVSGYPGWEAFFDRANVPVNLRNYSRLFLEVHTAVPLVGLVAVALLLPPLARRVVARARIDVAAA